jgi:hypothetical protein
MVTRWQNPDSFQIVCCGLDGVYAAPNAPHRVAVFPIGRCYVGPNFNGPPGGYDDEELDNLTNLLRVNLGDARSEARGNYPGGRSADVSIAVPIVLWSVVVLILVLFTRKSANFRPIGGRSRANAAPDFSHVEARQAVGAEVDESTAGERNEPTA